MSTIMIVILVLAVLLLVGGLGHQRWGAWGWSPLGLLLVLLLVLWLTGHLGHGWLR